MKSAVLWLLAIAVAAALTVLAFLPATWLGSIVEEQTGGRLTLGDAQGTLWRGSAFVGGAAGASGAVTPLLPAERLAGLGAPLNTLAPSGTMKLSWSTLQLARADKTVAVNGRTLLTLDDMGSRLAPIKPLGSYEMTMDWRDRQAQLSLRTVRGALLLSGTGALEQGRFRFSGQAQAADGYEETLGNLLNLLGQRRMVGGKKITALEFK